MLDDQLQPSPLAHEKGWDNAVEASLRALSRLNSGKIAAFGACRHYRRRSAGQGHGDRQECPYQLKRDLPELFSSSENIKWKEPDVSSGAGAAIVPRINEIIRTNNGTATGSLPQPDPHPPHDSN